MNHENVINCISPFNFKLNRTFVQRVPQECGIFAISPLTRLIAEITILHDEIFVRKSLIFIIQVVEKDAEEFQKEKTKKL